MFCFLLLDKLIWIKRDIRIIGLNSSKWISIIDRYSGRDRKKYQYKHTSRYFNFFLYELHLKKEFLENDISRRTRKNLAFLPPQNVIKGFVRMKENATDLLDDKKIFA